MLKYSSHHRVLIVNGSKDDNIQNTSKEKKDIFYKVSYGILSKSRSSSIVIVSL